ETRFEALVRQYGRLITAVVARVGGARAAGARDDVAQEVLLALWKRLEREQTMEVGSSYVYKAAVRETVRALRREGSKRQETLDENTAPPNSPASGPFEHLAESERGARIEACLGSLPLERERAVRAHLRGFEIGEIMGLYGWPYQKARNLVARGMTDLRRLLREQGIHD
ncbi:MAG TPA: sigma-70 family RNA polymerase sigma factor, partial [Vicinamibacteria bacterium]|nr:sigma-70 family RNA polymerase sigma factor [Vicinamibacteria bacterium]